jgi:hypothetical protein
MFFETFVEIEPSFGGGPDQMNPAARRFRFQAKRLISRALI